MYRLFIDEVGHDNLRGSSSAQEKHLCLLGVILNGRGHLDLTQRMNALKIECFGNANVVFHRREIIDRTPPFDTLKDPKVVDKYNVAMMTLFEEAQYTALAVQIDKQAHLAKYLVWHFRPYQYCLTVIVERYVSWLKDISEKIGKTQTGDVMVEWRGIKPNKYLEESYSRLYQKGTENVCAADMQNYLSSSQLKIEKKEANIAGLQLADLLASPASRYLICRKAGIRMTAPFGREVMKILIKYKFRRSASGRLDGYGVKCLP
jgi:hypothetical protein